MKKRKSSLKLLLIALSVLFVAGMLFVLLIMPMWLHQNQNSVYSPVYELGSLGASSTPEELHVSRACVLTPLEQNAVVTGVQVTDRYVLKNDGPDTELTLVYLSTCGARDNGFTMTVDGEPCDSWSGVFGEARKTAEQNDGVYDSRLRDGSYLRTAFPDWPALDKFRHEIDDHVDGLGEDVVMTSCYHACQLRIPAGKTVLVTVQYPMEYAAAVQLVQTEYDLPLDEFTLSETALSQLQLERMGQRKVLPPSEDWSVQLDPADYDRYMLLTGR